MMWRVSDECRHLGSHYHDVLFATICHYLVPFFAVFTVELLNDFTLKKL